MGLLDRVRLFCLPVARKTLACALLGLAVAPASAVAAGASDSPPCDPAAALCLTTPSPWIAPQYLTYQGPASERGAVAFSWIRGTRSGAMPATVVASDAQRVSWRVKLPAALHDGALTLRAVGTSPPLETVTHGQVRQAVAHPTLSVQDHGHTFDATLGYEARASVAAQIEVRLRGRYIADAWQTLRTWNLTRSSTATGVRRVVLGLGARAILHTCKQLSSCELEARGRLTAVHSKLADLTAHLSVPTPRERPTGGLSFVPGQTSVAGHGRLFRYALYVEGGLQVDRRVFARDVYGTLSDSRSWRRSGRVAFQQVADRRHANTRIIIASPSLVDRLCYPLRTRGYVSCTRGATVILNVNRWRYAVRHWPLGRLNYRHMLINHEVGHRLGQHHRHCGGHGGLAPVMQQQTYSLQGCRANPWPLSYEIASVARTAAAARAGQPSPADRPRSWRE